MKMEIYPVSFHRQFRLSKSLKHENYIRLVKREIGLFICLLKNFISEKQSECVIRFYFLQKIHRTFL